MARTGRRALVYPADKGPPAGLSDRPEARKYFFHTINVIRDRQGTFLPNDTEAKRHADNLSALLDLRKASDRREWRVQVTDESGIIVYETPGRGPIIEDET